MARLFITPREVQYINDTTKEFMKDVVGQTIHYFPISTLKTDVHPVYDEAVEKIFENPIKLDVLADAPDRDQNVDPWSLEGTTTIEVYTQVRDMIDKDMAPETGDFFVYGSEVFEILTVEKDRSIFGQIEYGVSYLMHGKLVRSGRFDLETFKKLLEDKQDYQSSSVQKVFEQQRGLPENETDGALSDRRQVRDRLSDDYYETALGEGPRKVNTDDEEDKADDTNKEAASSFYNEG